MGLSVAWTAMAGGCGSWPRMASFALSSGRNCSKQTLLKVTALPSCPARSCRRPVSTAPWSGFVAPSGHRSVDETRLTVCDRYLGESELVSRIGCWTPFCDQLQYCLVRRVFGSRGRKTSVPALVSRYPSCRGGKLPFLSVDRQLPRFPYNRTQLTEGGPWRRPWQLLPKVVTVVVVACWCHDGRAVEPWFGGIVCIRRFIFVWWRPLRASGNPVLLFWRFWELRSGRILDCRGNGLWLCWEAGHPLVHISFLPRWELRQWLSIRYSSLPLVHLFFADQEYQRLGCRQSCTSRW